MGVQSLGVEETWPLCIPVPRSNKEPPISPWLHLTIVYIPPVTMCLPLTAAGRHGNRGAGRVPGHMACAALPQTDSQRQGSQE